MVSENKVQYNFTSSTIAVSVIGVTGLLALLANGLLIYTVTNQKRQKYVFGLQLIMVAAITDGAAGLSMALMALIRGILGYPEVFETSWYCPIFGSLTLYLSVMSAIIISTLALERFLICFQRFLSPRWTWTFLAMITVSLAIPAVGTSITQGYSPDVSLTYCVPGSSVWAKWMNRYTGAMFVLSFISLTIFYVYIFVNCMKLPPEHLRFVSKQLASRALLFLVLYYFCFLPKFIATLWGMIGSRASRPIAVSIVSAAGLAMSTVINPVLSLFLHRHLRQQVSHIVLDSFPQSK